MRILIFISLLILQFFNSFSAITLTGDASSSGETFSFLTHQAQMSGNLFFTASNEVSAGNEYTVAVVGSGNAKFIPLAPKKIKLNNVVQDNPLTGAKISSLYIDNVTPVVAVDGLKKVFVIDGAKFGTASVNMLETVDLNGSNSVLINSILKTVGNGNYYLAAVTGGGSLGDVGSGISMITVTAIEEKKTVDGKEKSITVRKLTTLNADTGEIGGNKALALTGATPAIKVGDDAIINSNVIDMYWAGELQRFYISLNLTTGATATDKVRAVAIGRIAVSGGNNILVLDSIVPDAAILGTDQMVAAEGSSQAVAISKVRTMFTSTRLNYLIVAGGNGTSGNTVYSLPLVNLSQEQNVQLYSNANQGTLANFSQAPKEYYDKPSGSFLGRAFVEPATISAELLTSSSAAAKVGGGALPISAGDSIDGLFVAKDAVFVSISNNTVPNEPGLWQSQAILDSEGKIANWTAWQKVAGTTGKIFGAGVDFDTANYTYLTENSSGQAKVVKRTLWSDGMSDGLL